MNTSQTQKDKKKLYDSIGVVYCRHLDVDVTFNAKGFHHLFYEGDGTPRDKKECIYRLKLLPLIVPVIKYANEFIYEERETKTSRKKEAPIKLIKYWALIAWVGRDRNVQIKVVLRKIGNGQIHFWSVMKLKERNKKHQHD
jgi:hypothetical protein